MSEEFGSRLVQFRKRFSYSQEELANKLGVSRQSIINWESGVSSPSIDYVKDMAKLYGVTVDDLLDSNKPIEDCYKKEDSKSNKDNESIHISKKGIFINSSSDNVSIDDEGIFINGVKKKPKENESHISINKIAGLVDGIMIMLILIVYLAMGFIDSVYFLLLWPLFFTFEIPAGLIRCIGHKKPSEFPIVFIVLSLYCFLGTCLTYYTSLNGWHPFWVLFFLIPVYYSFAEGIKEIVNNKKKKDLVIEAEGNPEIKDDSENED